MTVATSGEIEALLGDIDPFVIEQIIDSGASPQDVAAALAAFEAGQRGEVDWIGTSPHVDAVRMILEDAYEASEAAEDYAWWREERPTG